MNERVEPGFAKILLLAALLMVALRPSTPSVAQDDHAVSSRDGRAYITFDENFPNSVVREINITDTCKDIEIFAADCCIRDDVVQVIVDGRCLLATVDSRGGDYGTHAGETHTISLPPGVHRIEYRNTLSVVGPSGWSVSETMLPFTKGITCRPQGLQRSAFPGLSCGGVNQDVLLDGLEDDAGNKYQVYCVDKAPYADEFRLFYVPQGGQRNVAGRCPYIEGRNPHKVLHTEDLDQNGKPDCFVKSSWTSRDGGADDDGDGKLDSRTYVYDVATDIVTRSYFEDGNLFCQDSWSPGPADPPPSPACAADEPARSGFVPAIAGLMTTESLRDCDLNEDGQCDGSDGAVFDSALGSCAGEATYHPNADFDLDGCIDASDQAAIFHIFQDGFEIGNPVLTWSAVSAGALSIASFRSTCPSGSCSFFPGTTVEYTTSVKGAPELYEYDWDSPDGVFRDADYSSTIPVTHHTFTAVGCFRPVLRIVRGAESTTKADDNTLNVGGGC